MKIKQSKNLRYEKRPWLCDVNGYDRPEPKFCFLARYKRENYTLILYFENDTHAEILAKNDKGEIEIDMITEKLDKFLGRPFEEILEAEF